MSKPSAFLQKLQQEQKRALYLHRLFTIQQSEDMMLIAANEAFGFGEERALKLLEKFREVFREYAEMTLEDGKDDRDITYTKGKLDQRLEAVMGKYFKPWEERYGGIEIQYGGKK